MSEIDKEKSIIFGNSNEENPSGIWERPTFGDENAVFEAYYYGIVECDGNTYMITKIKEAINENMQGQFFVVDTTATIYDDGSGIVFSDQEQSEVAKMLQEGLNSGKYSNIRDILKDKKIRFKDKKIRFKEGNEDFQKAIESGFKYDRECKVTAIRHGEFCKKLGYDLEIGRNNEAAENGETEKVELTSASEFFEKANSQTNSLTAAPIKRKWSEIFADRIRSLVQKGKEKIDNLFR